MSALELSQWLGRQSETSDSLSAGLLSRIAATFGVATPEPGTPLPLLWHWCFFQEPASPCELGEDGHPARGGFLPPAEGRNRMWAGSRIEFLGAFVAGGQALRRSTIQSIDLKQGRTGSLLFVTVLHEYFQEGKSVLREEQDIVYREPSAPKLSSTPMPQAMDWSEEVKPSSTLLFRYSAVTFNGHRIHYDWPYATKQEGYPGLVVHGPLIATLALQSFVRANPDSCVRRFSFKGVRPLISPAPFNIAGMIEEVGIAKIWAGSEAGVGQEGLIEYE